MADQPVADGAWIFVSHSHKDLRKVREIRDFLEGEGHHPLLFYLKCLEQNDARLPNLIRDEIKARNWFVLCDSENAQQSTWVQEEMRIVKAMPDEDRVYEIIDLTKDLGSQLHLLTSLSKRATVFISYARTDKEIAGQIYHELAKHDYRVFWDVESLRPATDWQRATISAIEEASRRGFVLVLLSPDYVARKYSFRELEYASKIFGEKSHTNIIPVIVRDREQLFSGPLLEALSYRLVDLTTGPISERIQALIADLKQRPMI